MTRRTLALGLDGCSWDLLEPLLAAGELPRLAGLLERSATARLEGVAPTAPTPAWVSFATGSTPAAHGVLEAHRLHGPATQADLLRVPYYLQLGREGRSTIVVNLPLDHTGCEGGLIVNDGLSPASRRILPVGRRAKYLRLLEVYPGKPLDPTDAAELCALEQARFDLARELFLGESWDHFFLLFSEPRWLARAAAGAFAAGDASARDAFVRLLRQVDRHVGWFVDHCGDALVAVVSAYGHRPERYVLRPDALLAELGLGGPAPEEPRRTARRRFVPFGGRRAEPPAETVAAPPEARLTVHARDAERVRDALLALSVEDGPPAVEQVLRFEELAGRPAGPGDPTLVLAPARGVGVAAGPGPVLAASESIAGAPDVEGILLLSGPAVAPGELRPVSVCDVAPTLLWAAGAGIPNDVEGRVLFEAFELSFAASQPLREAESAPPEDDRTGLVAARLRALGYL